MDAAQGLHHGLCIHRIERGNRLVGEDDLGILHQRAGNRYTLLLPTREGLGPFGRMFGDTQTIQNLDRLVDVRHRIKVEHGRQRRAPVERAMQDVGDHIHTWHQIELLKDHRAFRLPCAFVFTLQGGDFAALKADRALRGIAQTVDHPQQGGFTCAGTSDDAQHAGFVDIKRRGFYSRFVAESLGQFIDAQHLAAPFGSAMAYAFRSNHLCRTCKTFVNGPEFNGAALAWP